MPTYICKCGEEFDGSEFQLCKDCPDCERAAMPEPQPWWYGETLQQATRIGDTIRVRAPQRFIPEPVPVMQWQPWVPDDWNNTITVTTTNATYLPQAEVATQILRQQANQLANAAMTETFGYGYGFMGQNGLNNQLGGNIGRATTENRNVTDQEHEELAF